VVDRASLARLRDQPGYVPFVAAATIARVSDEMFGVGVVLLVLDRTGSPELAGLALAAITLPSVVTAPLLGAWLDVTGRRRALMMFDQVVVAAMLVALVLAVGELPDWTVPVIVLAGGLTYPLSFGGFTSLVPAIVPEELLPPANALETASFNSATVLGPALAGALAAALGPAAPVLAEAALALVALVLIARLPGLDRPARRDRAGMVTVVVAGLRELLHKPPLRAITATGAVGMAGLGLLAIAFPLFAVEELAGRESDAGYLWAAFALGSTTGALAFIGVQRRLRPETVALAGFAAFGALMLLWPLASSVPVGMALVALAGLADGPALAAQFAVRQQTVPRELHGQVFTTAAGIKVGAFAVGAALAGPVVAEVGAADAIVLAAAAQVAAAALGTLLLRLPGRALAQPRGG
jgi:predicted MFS family arabinose efflux permease